MSTVSTGSGDGDVSHISNIREPDSKSRRLVGLDAARGLALIGMFLVHFIPVFNLQTMSPTPTGLLFAGRSAALFVVLAGVGLAIVAHRHRRRKASSSSLARKIIIRAAVIAVIGILLGTLGTPVSVILVNYALLFIIALPFLSARPTTLLLSAFGWLGLGSVAYWLIMNTADLISYPLLRSPGVTDLAEPHIILADALFAGYYPILTWGFYLLIGLWIGRVLMEAAARQRDRIAVLLTVYGAVIAGTTLIIHSLTVIFSNVVSSLAESIDHMSTQEVSQRLLTGLTEPELFTEPWWFLLATPHSNSPLSLLHSTGTALMVIGVCLLIARWQNGRALSLFTVLGTMPLTLYAWHILLFFFLAHPNSTVESIGGMVTLIAGAVLILVYGSRKPKRKAPLEALTTALSDIGLRKERA